jgi:sulfate permease, SulP family
MTVVTLLLLTGLFESLPEATLAAVVIAAVIELVDVPALARLYRVSTGRAGRALAVAARPDFFAALAALAGVLVFDTLPGLFIGIGASLALLIYRASRPHVAVLGRVRGEPDQWGDVERHSENEQPPGVVVLRVDAGLFFANADHVRAVIRDAAARGGVHAVVLDAETTPFLDVTAADMLAGLADELDREGVQLLLARDVGQVRDVLRRSGAAGALGVHGVFRTVSAAVEAAAHPPRATRARPEPVDPHTRSDSEEPPDDRQRTPEHPRHLGR